MKKTIILYLFLFISSLELAGVILWSIFQYVRGVIFKADYFDTISLIIILGSAMVFSIACILYQKHVKKNPDKAIEYLKKYIYAKFNQVHEK